MISPLLDEDAFLLVTRDLRIRRDDQDWLIHFRADAPVNYGLRLSSSALMTLVRVGEGSTPLKQHVVEETVGRLLKTFIETGFLLSTAWRVESRRVELAASEVYDIRRRISLENIGLLELETLVLYVLSRELSRRGAICEIGAHLPGSTAALALGIARTNHSGQVFSVMDQEWHRRKSSTLSPRFAQANPSLMPRFEKQLQAAGVRDRVHFLVNDGAGAAEEINADVSMVFIDPSHAFEKVGEELDVWWPLLKPGGCLLVHDYGNSGQPDITAAVDALTRGVGFFSVYQTLAIVMKPKC